MPDQNPPNLMAHERTLPERLEISTKRRPRQHLLSDQYTTATVAAARTGLPAAAEGSVAEHNTPLGILLTGGQEAPGA